MKKVLLLLLVLSLLVMTSACGGGGSSSGSVETSQVTINVSDGGSTANLSIKKASLFAAAKRFLEGIKGASVALAGIPSDVTHIIFTISAPDMVTITRDVTVAGQTVISETFTVPNGSNRLFTIEARNASGEVLYRGQIYANLNGQAITLTVNMTDVQSPGFKGLQSASAVGPTQINLSWDPASDNLTPAGNVVYQIYLATAQGGENFSSPSFTTNPGVTSYGVTGLQPNTTYFFVVRATDSSGNQDLNSVEKSATTFSPPNNPPGFGGLVSAVYNPDLKGADLSWNQATDDVTAPSNMVYLVYWSTTSHGQNFSSPSYTTGPGVTAHSVANLTPGTYYFVVRARDEAGNTDTNTVERSVVIPDSTPPTFSGLQSATATCGQTMNVTLSWNQAADDVTSSSTMVYLIYRSTTPGGENFEAPTYTVTGQTSHTITGLTPGTYYFVVRARDGAGNIDTNTVEQSVVCIPDTAPTFSGLQSASATCGETMSVTLTWNQAADDNTSPSTMVYLIYQSTTSKGQNFSSPTYQVTGQTSHTINNLTPGTYYFVVRARDGAGNIDTNTVERSAICIPDTAPTFSGLQSASATCGETMSVTLTWNQAADDNTTPSNMVYLIYQSTTSKGQNFSSPTYQVTGQTSHTINNLTPGTYYFVVRARDGAGNIDTNTVERSAICIIDEIVPSFNGLESASATCGETMSVTLSWSPATDNVTPADKMVYLVYRAKRSGEQNYATPSSTTKPGATSHTITGLTPGTYYFVVRARDEAGNIDTNTVQKVVDCADHTRPTVVEVSPEDGSEFNDPPESVSVTFSEPMDTSTINASTFYVSCGWEGQDVVDGSITYSNSGRTATWAPGSYYDGDCTVRVTTGVTDEAGNHMSSSYIWEFYVGGN